MKKFILNIVLFLSVTKAFACVCITTKLVDAVTQSDFIATAKITRIIPDSIHPEYKITTIALIDVYKGERITTLRINTADNTSCQFDLPLHSTWLFFARKNADGTFGFGACSKSEQIDRQLDSLKYPIAPGRYRHSVEFNLKVLSYLRDKKINPINTYELYTRSEPNVSEKFKGVNITDKEFAIYQIKVGEDLAVQKVKALKDWGDAKLKSEFTAFLQTSLKVKGDKKQSNIPASTELTLIFYAYQPEDVYPSFIAEWDL